MCQREQCLLLGEGGELVLDVGEVPAAGAATLDGIVAHSCGTHRDTGDPAAAS
jgi:hypothetical protein